MISIDENTYNIKRFLRLKNIFTGRDVNLLADRSLKELFSQTYMNS